jgi:hypothetical protein
MVSKVAGCTLATIPDELNGAHSMWSNLSSMDASPIAPTSDESSLRENRLLDEALFSLNIAGALFLGALLYVLKNWASMKPANDSTYLYLRSMYRVIDFLGLQSQNPVATSAVRRQFPSSSEQFGAEVFVMLTWLGITATAALLLRLLSHTRIYRAILAPAAITTLLFAAPVCYLYVSWLTWNWMSSPGAAVGSFLTQSLPLAVFVIEVVCLGVLLLFSKRKEVPRWIKILFVSVHCAFWMAVLWSDTRIVLFPIYSRDLILLVFPVSLLVFMFRRGRMSSRLSTTTESRKTVWNSALAAVALLVAGVVWSPSRNIGLSHPHNLDSATVELSRGPCFGSCPAYTVMVHGDGEVQYVGQQGRRSRIQTKKSGTVPREKVQEILQVLDRVEFTALEGRAFFWAFDTPSVGVRTSVDGKTKQVASDASFVGAPKGRQARFVEATREIDDILASTTWLKCEGECENSVSSP